MNYFRVVPLLAVLILAGGPAVAAGGEALRSALSAAGVSDLAELRTADAGPAAPVAPDRPFCTSDFFVYRDRPITGYSLTCRNSGLGLVLYHSTGYESADLFGANGRCSPRHRSSIALWSRDTIPFQLGHDNAKPASGKREFAVYRDPSDLRRGTLLARLIWIQGSDEFRLGFDPRSGRIQRHPFLPLSGTDRDSIYRLRASGLTLNVATSTLINGKPIHYRDVPVDCVLEISAGDWSGR
jgi:hypothetical protein